VGLRAAHRLPSLPQFFDPSEGSFDFLERLFFLAGAECSPLSVQLSGNLIEVIAYPGELQNCTLALYSVLVRWACPVSPDSTRNLENDKSAFFASTVGRICSLFVSFTKAPFGYCLCRFPILST
jgi:hypothetical protein